jgi:hypothetical protein
MKTKRECHYTRELDLQTLVWTCGPNFPLSSLDGRPAGIGPYLARRLSERKGYVFREHFPVEAIKGRVASF